MKQTVLTLMGNRALLFLRNLKGEMFLGFFARKSATAYQISRFDHHGFFFWEYIKSLVYPIPVTTRNDMIERIKDDFQNQLQRF